MPYLGPGVDNGYRSRFIYTATAGQTSFSGGDANGITLTYTDSEYLDVYQNGVLLVPGDDYAATTGTTVVLVQGASLNDKVEMIQYQAFGVADTVSRADGGAFGGNISTSGTLTVTGDATFDTSTLKVDSTNNRVGVGTTSPDYVFEIETAENAIANFKSTDANANIRFTDSNSTANGYAGIGAIGDDLTLIAGNDNRMKIDSAGHVTMPNQPAFQARPSSNQNNIATDTQTTIALGTEVFDVNGDFASNTFTAPVTGKYALKVQVRLDNLDSAASYYRIDIVTSNRSYYYLFDPDFGQDQSYWTVTNSVVADMDANDTASIKFLQDSSGAAQTDIFGSADGYTLFSGYLVA